MKSYVMCFFYLPSSAIWLCFPPPWWGTEQAFALWLGWHLQDRKRTTQFTPGFVHIRSLPYSRVFQHQLGYVDVKINQCAHPQVAVCGCNKASGGATCSTQQRSTGRDGGTMTREGWQVTYVIVIRPDTAPEAAEALVLLQAFELPSEPPAITSCSHSEGQGSNGSQHCVGHCASACRGITALTKTSLQCCR